MTPEQAEKAKSELNKNLKRLAYTLIRQLMSSVEF